VRLAGSPELSAWIEQRVAAYPSESPEPTRWLASSAVEAGVLPLYAGGFETIGLGPDGEIVSWLTEGEYPGVRPVEDRYLWLSALVNGAKRYPQLQPSLPRRPPSARDCWHLDHPLFADGKLFCPECCGLGWIEALCRTARSRGPGPPQRLVIASRWFSAGRAAELDREPP
jgi:hypothetical protein